METQVTQCSELTKTRITQCSAHMHENIRIIQCSVHTYDNTNYTVQCSYIRQHELYSAVPTNKHYDPTVQCADRVARSPVFYGISRIAAYHFTICPMPLCMKITISFEPPVFFYLKIWQPYAQMETRITQRMMETPELSTGHFSWTRSDPTRRNVDPTRPAIADKSLTRPDPRPDPSPICAFILNNYLLII